MRLFIVARANIAFTSFRKICEACSRANLSGIPFGFSWLNRKRYSVFAPVGTPRNDGCRNGSALGYALFLLPILLLMLPHPATAHPHVWINYHVKVVSDAQGIRHLNFTWQLDSMFTDMMLEDFKLKTITEKDSAFIHDHAFVNLKNYHYYMDIKADGQAFKPQDVSNFKSYMKGKTLMYEFTVDLPKSSQKIELSLYDPEFYVDIEPPMQEMGSESGLSMMAESKLVPMASFLSVGADDGAVAPDCKGHDGDVRKSKLWGDFPVYVVSCSAKAG